MHSLRLTFGLAVTLVALGTPSAQAQSAQDAVARLLTQVVEEGRTEDLLLRRHYAMLDQEGYQVGVVAAWAEHSPAEGIVFRTFGYGLGTFAHNRWGAGQTDRIGYGTATENWYLMVSLEVGWIGIALLLFTVGLEFSLPRIFLMRRELFVGGGGQVLLTIVVVFVLSLLGGVEWRQALLFAFLAALSSTLRFRPRTSGCSSSHRSASAVEGDSMPRRPKSSKIARAMVRSHSSSTCRRRSRRYRSSTSMPMVSSVRPG